MERGEGDAHDIAQVWCSRRARRASHSRLDLARLRHLSDFTSQISDVLFVFFRSLCSFEYGGCQDRQAQTHKERRKREI
jgi:hypothetical protein